MKCTIRAAMTLSLVGTMLLAGCSERTLLSVRKSSENALASGHPQVALADAQEYVDRAPERAAGRLLLGRALLANGRAPEACEQLFIARSLNTDDDEVLEALLAALYADGRQEDVYRVARERVVDRGLLEDYYRLAAYAQRFEDMDTAQQALLTAAQLDEGRTVEPQLWLAEFHLSTGDREAALQRFRMAYWVSPDDERVLTGIRGMDEVPGPTMPPAELPDLVEVNTDP